VRRFATLLAALLLAPGAPAAAETLRVANPGQPASLDPHRITGIWENRIVGDMFVGLLTEGPAGELIPGVAERYTVSGDGRVYEFELRESFWSDGRPVTGEDFVYAFRRMLAPETASPYADFFYVIEGAREYTRGRGAAGDVAVRAPEPDRLVIELERPTAYFPGLLTHFAAFPVPPHVVATNDDWTAAGVMVSNGAYVLASRVATTSVTLERNPRFYDRENVAIERVRYETLEDGEAAMQRFRAGELDIVYDFPPGRIDWVRRTFGDAVHVSAHEGLTYFAVNHAREPFGDARVREALSLALDRQVITGKLLGTGESPALGLVPPGVDNYGRSARYEWAGVPRSERLDRARALMAAAGYGPDRPLELELRYDLSEEDRRVALAAQAMWRDIGVEASPLRSETAVHYATLANGDYDVGLASWLAVYSDPQTFTLLLETESGSNNLSNFSHDRYDALTSAAARTADLAERAALLREAEALALELSALIPVFHHAARNLVSPRVAGWRDNGLNVHRTRHLRLRDD
jgi:oligopeptide transport system substrate-binding protein